MAIIDFNVRSKNHPEWESIRARNACEYDEPEFTVENLASSLWDDEDWKMRIYKGEEHIEIEWLGSIYKLEYDLEPSFLATNKEESPDFDEQFWDEGD